MPERLPTWRHSSLPVVFFAALLGMAALLPAKEARAQNVDFDACLAFDRKACDTVLGAQAGNLTALFMRGLAAELDGDDAAALQDFDATVAREPRHFGAQLWRHVAAATLKQSRAAELSAYLGNAKQLPAWPRALAELYLDQASPEATLALAEAQPQAARSEAICAAEYHIGRYASLKGDAAAAQTHFRAALATGAAHVFEYQAAERALAGME
jgi:lipoprotein NlpI